MPVPRLDNTLTPIINFSAGAARVCRARNTVFVRAVLASFAARYAAMVDKSHPRSNGHDVMDSVDVQTNGYRVFQRSFVLGTDCCDKYEAVIKD